MTMLQTLSIYPPALAGYNQQVQNYKNWLIKFVSPVTVLAKYKEAEALEDKLRAKYGAAFDLRKEYCTFRYAIEVLLTNNKFFYQTDPGTKYKPELSEAEDQFYVDVMNTNDYPFLVGLQGLTLEQQKYLMSVYTIAELRSAFLKGVEQDLKSYVGYNNINSAQLVVGLKLLFNDSI